MWGLDYLLAVISGIFHTEEVSVGPSIQVTVLSAYASVPSISWLAFAAEHGLREDAQVDAICIFMAVVASVLARVAGSANLKKITDYLKKKSNASCWRTRQIKVLIQTCFLAVASATPLPKG